MVPLSITLHSSAYQIKAQIGGKDLSFPFRPLSGGAVPPGRYTLSAPMHNSVYGTFALLTAVGRAGAPSGWIGQGWISQGWINKGWVNEGWISPTTNHPAGAGWVNRTDWIGAGSGWIENVNQPGVYVMVEKSVPARNGILITSGFAQLMAALQQAGGATITVA